MKAQFAIGSDYGTNSVRALIVNVANVAEESTPPLMPQTTR
jgi:ribulose kinase